MKNSQAPEGRSHRHPRSRLAPTKKLPAIRTAMQQTTARMASPMGLGATGNMGCLPQFRHTTSPKMVSISPSATVMVGTAYFINCWLARVARRTASSASLNNSVFPCSLRYSRTPSSSMAWFRAKEQRHAPRTPSKITLAAATNVGTIAVQLPLDIITQPITNNTSPTTEIAQHKFRGLVLVSTMCSYPKSLLC